MQNLTTQLSCSDSVMTSYTAVNTRRYLDVDSTSFRRQTTLCAYWDLAQHNYNRHSTKFNQ